MAEQVCAVCGAGGYWVAWSPRHGENRCINHTRPKPDVEGSDHG